MTPYRDRLTAGDYAPKKPPKTSDTDTTATNTSEKTTDKK